MKDEIKDKFQEIYSRLDSLEIRQNSAFRTLKRLEAKREVKDNKKE